MIPAIVAIGTANPVYMRYQKDAAELVSAGLHLKKAHHRLLKSVYQATGITKRHSVLSDYCKAPGEFTFFPNDENASFPTTAQRMALFKETALPLALKAIENLSAENLALDLQTITHLITVSCTGLYAPGIDIEIIQTLNLPTTIKRTTINFMGCYGAFNALRVAEAICTANTKANVLIVNVELCTIHFQNSTTLDNMISNAIFADGASATWVKAIDAQARGLTLKNFYCDLLPQTAQAMAWEVGNHGFDIVLSSYVPDIIEKDIRSFLLKAIHAADLSLTQLDYFAIHPGGLKILEAVEKALSLTKQQNQHAYDVLQDFGNMSSVTIFFVLQRFLKSLDDTARDKHIFACAFGPGLTLESLVLQTQV